ncbi:MAG: phosphoenolpyruvate carboxykinase (ATP) [Synergistaceae bacterium]|jgi:phosphoenolpyruvate carboxykinase (ATP)|nr:phosphoenolpyruvate carboxykinase (ATP) [Synergistaceae bacterium]
MATIGHYDPENFKKMHQTPIRTTVESLFYGNNVKKVPDLKVAYELAKASPGAVELTGMPVYKPEEQGLPAGANVLLFNDGAFYGRTAAARRIIGYPNVKPEEMATLVREAIYNMRYRQLYTADAYIGLEEDFMVAAHLIVPQGFENNLYSWMFNFQYVNEKYKEMYNRSRQISDTDGDVFIFADPDWTHPDYPMGLAFFSPKENCAVVLGLRYFGELKKGTLTLGWGIGARNGYASCHGGLKRYSAKNGRKFVLAAFGLSGSGKSTITHATHGGKYEITVLHDDAFVVNVKDKYAIALEPAYFDKVQDYPIGCPDNKFLVTMQNCGVTRQADGTLIAVTEDVRNGNGRAMKSKFWSPNRIDRIDEPLNAIFWLMRDPTIPPVLKLTGPELGSVLGATLATKRTSAERLAPGVDPNALVCEPYANPFRTYPLEMDYTRFKQLLADGVDCYILNTGDFMGTKVKPTHTLGILEAIIEGSAKWAPFGNFTGMQILPIDDFKIDVNDKAYREQLHARFKDRLNFVKSRDTELGGLDKLPPDAHKAIELATEEIGKY